MFIIGFEDEEYITEECDIKEEYDDEEEYDNEECGIKEEYEVKEECDIKEKQPEVKLQEIYRIPRHFHVMVIFQTIYYHMYLPYAKG